MMANYYAPSTECTGNGGGDRAGCHAPGESVGGGAGGAGESLAEAIPPPSMVYVGTIKGFGMQKFFFEFRVPCRDCWL